MTRSRRLPTAFLVATCLACGARSPLAEPSTTGTDAGDTPDTTLPASLSVVLGAYSECNLAAVTRRTNLVGVSGTHGAIAVRRDGGRVVATLDFGRVAAGEAAFVPTSATTAVLAGAQHIALEIADPGTRGVTLAATTGALTVVGSTLFFSMHGAAGDDDLSAFVHCRIPEAQPTVAVPLGATPEPVTVHTWSFCTASSGTDVPVQTTLSGAVETVTVRAEGASRRVAWPGALLGAWTCDDLRFEHGDGVATLSARQTCTLRQPCGPPPTLGPSPFPSTATLDGLRGVAVVQGATLFVHVTGEANVQACGRHDLSIVCVGP